MSQIVEKVLNFLDTPPQAVLDYFKERSVSQPPDLYEGHRTASDWPSSPRKEGWNYSVDCLANQRPFCVPHKGREADSQISLSIDTGDLNSCNYYENYLYIIHFLEQEGGYQFT